VSKTAFHKACFFIFWALIWAGFLACARSPGGQAYLDSGCARCHGANFSGTQLGPPLSGLASNWTESDLTLYLKNPSGYLKKDARIKALSEQYKVVRPRFEMDPEQRRLLVEFLLKEAD